jgi:hypothetical protein
MATGATGAQLAVRENHAQTPALVDRTEMDRINCYFEVSRHTALSGDAKRACDRPDHAAFARSMSAETATARVLHDAGASVGAKRRSCALTRVEHRSTAFVRQSAASGRQTNTSCDRTANHSSRSDPDQDAQREQQQPAEPIASPTRMRIPPQNGQLAPGEAQKLRLAQSICLTLITHGKAGLCAEASRCGLSPAGIPDFPTSSGARISTSG